MASHGKNSPGKPKKYLNSLTGCGGHINGAGTVNGNSGVQPLAFELGDSMGELMSSFLRGWSDRLEARRKGAGRVRTAGGILSASGQYSNSEDDNPTMWDSQLPAPRSFTIRWVCGSGSGLSERWCRRRAAAICLGRQEPWLGRSYSR